MPAPHGVVSRRQAIRAAFDRDEAAAAAVMTAAGVAILTRKQAVELGLETYLGPRRCPRGHWAPRLVKSGSCVLCAKKRQRHG